MLAHKTGQELVDAVQSSLDSHMVDPHSQGYIELKDVPSLMVQTTTVQVSSEAVHIVPCEQVAEPHLHGYVELVPDPSVELHISLASMHMLDEAVHIVPCEQVAEPHSHGYVELLRDPSIELHVANWHSDPLHVHPSIAQSVSVVTDAHVLHTVALHPCPAGQSLELLHEMAHPFSTWHVVWQWDIIHHDTRCLPNRSVCMVWIFLRGYLDSEWKLLC